MDYYKRKKIAMEHIRKLVENGTLTRDDIQFRILEKYQLGEKFVDKYIDQLIDKDFAKEVNGYVMDSKEVDLIAK